MLMLDDEATTATNFYVKIQLFPVSGATAFADHRRRPASVSESAGTSLVQIYDEGLGAIAIHLLPIAIYVIFCSLCAASAGPFILQICVSAAKPVRKSQTEKKTTTCSAPRHQDENA